MAQIDVERRRTRPDFEVFIPQSLDASTGMTGNEHFLVEKLANGSLFALWTQSSVEGASDQHLVVSKSADDGASWSTPTTIAGPDPSAGVGMASWGFPLVSAGGRIYVVFSRHIGINDIFTHTTGEMRVMYSDDVGETWSPEWAIDMPDSIWNNPDRTYPANWIVWQKPIRLDDGRYFSGFTRWMSPVVHPDSIGSVVEFMRFENVDDNPGANELVVTFLNANDSALRLEGHVLQEPSLVHLPDGRLFCVMRSDAGTPYWSTSADSEGTGWSDPQPLRQHDGGPLIAHPLSPCPIYEVDEGEYAFFYHNHDGHFLRYLPEDLEPHRRPICLARGQYRAGAEQPVWFSDPFYYMDSGGVRLVREGMSMYSSVTPTSEGIVLWYPDRKFFLLGKWITRDELTALAIVDPSVSEEKFSI